MSHFLIRGCLYLRATNPYGVSHSLRDESGWRSGVRGDIVFVDTFSYTFRLEKLNSRESERSS